MTKNTKTTPESSITTLHQAFDAYRVFIEHYAGAEATAWEKHRLSVVARLREEHPDEPLAELNLDRCAHLIDHWKNRPVGRNGNRLSRRTCVNFLNELVRFLRWLDMCDESQWEIPRRLDLLNRRVVRLHSDQGQLQRYRITIDELRLLYQHADKLDRLMICLALNCGLGPADMGRLTAKSITLADEESALPYVPSGYAVLQSEFPGTRSYREHVLWHETHELLLWAIERAHHLGREELFVTDHGKPMFDKKGRNPSAAITRRFRRLVDRLRISSPAFASLSLTSIRRLGIELVHRIAGCEVASLHVGHKQHPDILIYCCEGPQYRQLHSAILEVRHQVGAIFEMSNQPAPHPLKSE